VDGVPGAVEPLPLENAVINVGDHLIVNSQIILPPNHRLLPTPTSPDILLAVEFTLPSQGLNVLNPLPPNDFVEASNFQPDAVRILSNASSSFEALEAGTVPFSLTAYHPESLSPDTSFAQRSFAVNVFQPGLNTVCNITTTGVNAFSSPNLSDNSQRSELSGFTDVRVYGRTPDGSYLVGNNDIYGWVPNTVSDRARIEEFTAGIPACSTIPLNMVGFDINTAVRYDDDNPSGDPDFDGVPNRFDLCPNSALPGCEVTWDLELSVQRFVDGEPGAVEPLPMDNAVVNVGDFLMVDYQMTLPPNHRLQPAPDQENALTVEFTLPAQDLERLSTENVAASNFQPDAALLNQFTAPPINLEALEAGTVPFSLTAYHPESLSPDTSFAQRSFTVNVVQPGLNAVCTITTTGVNAFSSPNLSDNSQRSELSGFTDVRVYGRTPDGSYLVGNNDIYGWVPNTVSDRARIEEFTAGIPACSTIPLNMVGFDVTNAVRYDDDNPTGDADFDGIPNHFDLCPNSALPGCEVTWNLELSVQRFVDGIPGAVEPLPLDNAVVNVGDFLMVDYQMTLPPNHRLQPAPDEENALTVEFTLPSQDLERLSTENVAASNFQPDAALLNQFTAPPINLEALEAGTVPFSLTAYHPDSLSPDTSFAQISFTVDIFQPDTVSVVTVTPAPTIESPTETPQSTELRATPTVVTSTPTVTPLPTEAATATETPVSIVSPTPTPTEPPPERIVATPTPLPRLQPTATQAAKTAPRDSDYRLVIDGRGGATFSEAVSGPDGDTTDTITVGTNGGSARYTLTVTCQGTETAALALTFSGTRELLGCGARTVVTLEARQAYTIIVDASRARQASYVEYTLQFTP
jgi:hypothetical protein